MQIKEGKNRGDKRAALETKEQFNTAISFIQVSLTNVFIEHLLCLLSSGREIRWSRMWFLPFRRYELLCGCWWVGGVL